MRAKEGGCDWAQRSTNDVKLWETAANVSEVSVQEHMHTAHSERGLKSKAGVCGVLLWCRGRALAIHRRPRFEFLAAMVICCMSHPLLSHCFLSIYCTIKASVSKKIQLYSLGKRTIPPTLLAYKWIISIVWVVVEDQTKDQTAVSGYFG